MTQEKVVRLLIYYTDAGCIEKVVSAFRKLLIDVNWIWGRRIDSLYEIYLGVEEHPNLKLALLNLCKTVGIEYVELLLDARIERYAYLNGEFKKVAESNNISENIYRDSNHFIIYVPTYTRMAGCKWGEKYGENI
ncbi:MAG: hypothetical protein QXJ56_03405 [Ignisphaera sp.]|uniref:Uncharacterized protein n=1 Tax=Ignisphaera aggregans TaxID=334771 RepID=A0A7J3JQM2_9CREN